MLCVHNLARSAQAVELDLSEYEGYSPIEMFGRSRFPRIGELPYLLTLAPRGFYWFQLVKDETGMTNVTTVDLSFLDEQVFNEWIVAQRWFASKTREVSSIAVDRLGRAARGPAAARPDAGRGTLPDRHARDLPGPARAAAAREGWTSA